MLNTFITHGRLGKDPELKGSVVVFTIANDVKRKETVTTWLNCVAFGRTGETICKYLKKGSQAIFIGRIQQESWEKDGKKMTALKFVVENIDFVGGQKKDGDSVAEAFSGEEEEMPF